jgi:hypothetical protein
MTLTPETGEKPRVGVKCLTSSRQVAAKGRNLSNGLARARPIVAPKNMEHDLDCLRNRPLVPILIAILLLAAAVVHAHTPGAITGKVVDRHGNPMRSVVVTAADAVTGVGKRAVTDASGNYNIDPLSPAPYVVRAEAESYGCIIVPEVIVDEGQRIQQNFRFTGDAAPAGCEPVPSKKCGKKVPKS